MNQIVYEILDKIEHTGYSAYLAGGSIRSHLFNEKINDYDIATDAPFKVLNELFGAVDISKNFDLNVFLIEVQGYSFEIAQFRGDEDTLNTDKDAPISSFKKDAEHRDFTINALFMDKHGTIIDCVNGIDDIKNKILRCVGDPQIRFNEDALRIMRAVRFLVKFDLTFDKNTENVLRKSVSALKSIRVERITQEIEKAMDLGSEKFATYVTRLFNLGILKVILPEVATLNNFEYAINFNLNGYEESLLGNKNTLLKHVVECLRVNESLDKNVYWAILLRDVGKPEVFKVRKKNGKIKWVYQLHSIPGAVIALNIAKRLKLSKKTTNICVFCVKNSSKLYKSTKFSVYKLYKLYTHRYFAELFAVSISGILSRSGKKAITDAKNLENNMQELEKKLPIVEKINSEFMKHNLRKEVEPGKKYGNILEMLKKFACNIAIDIIDVEDFAYSLDIDSIE